MSISFEYGIDLMGLYIDHAGKGKGRKRERTGARREEAR